SRFLSREDRPLVAGGILAGLLTSVLVLYLFVTGIGGDGGGTEIVTDTMRVLEREDLVRGEVRDEKPARAPLIGARERDIRSRLARFPVQVRRIRGAIAVTARNVAWNEAGGARFARAERVR